MFTGASEGIGRGYALEISHAPHEHSWTNTYFDAQLARQGLNVVIMSRTLEKLTAVEREISEALGVWLRIVLSYISLVFPHRGEVQERGDCNSCGLLRGEAPKGLKKGSTLG